MDQGHALQPAQGHRQPDRGELLKLAEVVLSNKPMYRAFLLYGELRYIYRLPKQDAPERLKAWASARG